MTADSEITLGFGARVPEPFEHGARCVVEPQAFVADGCVFEDDVTVGTRATLMPPSREDGPQGTELLIRSGTRIGAGVVVSGASIIERGARIEAGAVVTADVPPYAIVAGNPAFVVGYVSPPSGGGSGAVEHIRVPHEPGATELIGGASVIRFPDAVDLRGSLTFGEVGGLLPFEVQRFFCVYDVPSRSIRGEHSHRTLHELLIAASGSVRVSLTDGQRRCEIVLESPNVGLYLPPLIWSTQYSYSEAAVLLVLCSDPYDPSSYIRTYDEFLSLIE